MLKKYEVWYICGFSMRYKKFLTTGTCKEEAIHNLWVNEAHYGNFEHQIISVKER